MSANVGGRGGLGCTSLGGENGPMNLWKNKNHNLNIYSNAKPDMQVVESAMKTELLCLSNTNNS